MQVKITSADEFINLRSSSDPEKYLRAANGEASNEVWLEVISLHSEYIRWVAHNKTIPEEIIRALSESSDPEVRYFIAAKRKTPSEILIKLASDPDEGVRRRVVNNEKAPIESLTILSGDTVGGIRQRAVEKIHLRGKVV